VLAQRKRLIALAFLFALFFGNQGFRSLISNWRQLRAVNRQIAELEKQKTQLQEKGASLRKGDAALERLARVELGYAKPQEVEYRFPPPAK
jgi:cell division protein FtsB